MQRLFELCWACISSRWTRGCRVLVGCRLNGCDCRNGVFGFVCECAQSQISLSFRGTLYNFCWRSAKYWSFGNTNSSSSSDIMVAPFLFRMMSSTRSIRDVTLRRLWGISFFGSALVGIVFAFFPISSFVTWYVLKCPFGVVTLFARVSCCGVLVAFATKEGLLLCLGWGCCTYLLRSDVHWLKVPHSVYLTFPPAFLPPCLYVYDPFLVYLSYGSACGPLLYCSAVSYSLLCEAR